MSDRVPLSFLLAEHGKEDPPIEPITPFDACREEAGGYVDITVTALLERTAAYHSLGDKYDTGALKFDRILVLPAEVKWKTATGARATENGQVPIQWNRSITQRGKPQASAEERAALRERSDARALENQAEVARKNEVEAAREVSQRLKNLSEPANTEPTPLSIDSSGQAVIVGVCVKCGARGRLNPKGICTRHGPRGKKGEPPTTSKLSVEANKGSIIKRPFRHRSRPEGCLVDCRPFRDDVYHAPGCPHRVEQLEKFNRKAPPTPGCLACAEPGKGVRHAVGCPHRRGPLSNAEMVALAAGSLRTVDPTTLPAAETALAVTSPLELAPIPVPIDLPTRSDWLALLTRLRAMKAENDVLRADLTQMFTDLREVLDA